ncbi:helix-turn-helix transcriptional regulator [Epilithonimonas mollis]|uniref:AraC-type DNA-binding protein n=1 Tax=Epilithonimonas mollis TaxID=216903 RepID=A0A1M6PGM6_9FLAO|nr:AraC family transcriptional regulator [Epilithonimonas mollis]SHK07101.1 AraC-type DNA-binding protein [Epilithonimonas mollis]
MFNRITEDNFRNIQLPRQSSLVNFSSFRELRTDVLFRSFSLKFVLEGCEQYLIDGHLFKVSKGDFLLGNHFSDGKLLIQSDEDVKGLCIDISPDIIAEVSAGFHFPELTEQDLDFEKYLISENFVENKYHFSQNIIGQQLSKISQQIVGQQHYNFDFSPEFYYRLAENIVSIHYPGFLRIKNLKTVKSHTRKSLYRKIQSARDYIDLHFATIQNIESVARESSISEYHFYRLFRQIQGESPYQYITQKKLQFAKQLLKDKSLSLTDVAFICGFTDLSSFSKNFKKHFRIPPGQFR